MVMTVDRCVVGSPATWPMLSRMFVSSNTFTLTRCRTGLDGGARNLETARRNAWTWDATARDRR
eukprot:2754786-Alexandrium_andersonii.AAC.1